MHVFVYGTLKHGGALHSHLANQRFLGIARTTTPCRLYQLGWYPGLVEDGDGTAIEGELWDVDEATLRVLDEVEGVETGLYERRPIRLQSPFEQDHVLAYFYLGDVTGCPDCGSTWDVNTPT